MTASGQAERRIDEYLTLPYTIRVTPDPTGGYVASVKELPGCITQADSWSELGAMVEDAMRAWIELCLEDGRTVPLPEDGASSARVLLRLPRSLHEELTAAARQEGVSFNQQVLYYLARATRPQREAAMATAAARPDRVTHGAVDAAAVTTASEKDGGG